MDKENIISLFTTGTLPAGEDSKTVLRNIVESFPYFQMAQVLYARQMYEENDAGITSQMKLASAYAPDRKAMYRLFRNAPIKSGKNPPQRITESSKIKAEALEKSLAKPKNEVNYNFVYAPKKESEITTTPPPPRLYAEKKELPNSSSLSETFLEKEITGAAAIAQAEKRIAEIPLSKEVEAPKIVENKAETKPTGVIEKRSVSAGERHSFSEWLMLLPKADIKAGTSIVETEPLKETTSIIDRFLANEPRISKPKAEFFSPTKAAKMSISEDDNLVSETLANIHALQGNLHLALKAFETLLLHNPEKKAYFANRIKEIRSQIDSGSAKNK